MTECGRSCKKKAARAEVRSAACGNDSLFLQINRSLDLISKSVRRTYMFSEWTFGRGNTDYHLGYEAVRLNNAKILDDACCTSSW